MSVDRQLEADLDWRAAELAALRLQLLTAPTGSTLETAALRALWIMLYAHYEGFAKFAFELYLDELERSGVTRAECIESLTVLSLEQDFKSLRGDMSRDACWNFFSQALPTALQKKLKFEVRPSTQSNLWPNVLQENCDSVGLSIATLTENTTKLATLVSRRNDIAHGQRNIIQSLDEYRKYEEAAFDVMYALAIEIADVLHRRSYMRAAA